MEMACVARVFQSLKTVSAARLAEYPARLTKSKRRYKNNETTAWKTLQTLMQRRMLPPRTRQIRSNGRPMTNDVFANKIKGTIRLAFCGN
jgi:hypothetical protein